MERNQGRRSPLVKLLERFTMDSLRALRDKDKVRATRKIEFEMPRHDKPKRRVYRKMTKRPMAHVKRERRARNKAARKSRARNRV